MIFMNAFGILFVKCVKKGTRCAKNYEGINADLFFFTIVQ